MFINAAKKRSVLSSFNPNYAPKATKTQLKLELAKFQQTLNADFPIFNRSSYRHLKEASQQLVIYQLQTCLTSINIHFATNPMPTRAALTLACQLYIDIHPTLQSNTPFLLARFILINALHTLKFNYNLPSFT
ncbi:hypothetical protein DSO57_1020583 [Entomophthora muscae]|uniref:Uncharacterized protein n=1 Tax=Entomophthora muscae TaxID=34485 RepID=A0ACC2SST8_9FUNG|nr:hypothetical protein DSO57_1020583 [Entomophthora muscae]